MTSPASSGRRDAGKKKHTPVMLQYLEAKERFPDALLFFRLGDFYEFFFEDAVRVSELLGLQLTSRSKGPDGEPIPMAGLPHHAAASRIAELLTQGQKVAICEQMADPASVRGVVPREVVRVITPGLCLEPDALDARSDCHLVASLEWGGELGLAAYEMSTAHLSVCRLSGEGALLAEISRLAPRELLLSPGLEHLQDVLSLMPGVAPAQLRAAPEGSAAANLERLLGSEEANALSLSAPDVAQAAAAFVLDYAAAHQPRGELKAPRISSYDPSSRLVLDEVAVRNLELLHTLSGDRRGGLLQLVDQTRCPMGARKLRRRLLAPLDELGAIRRRHDAVMALVEDAPIRRAVRDALSQVGDLERLTTRAEQGLASPRDLGALRDSLRAIQGVARALTERVPWASDDPLAELLPTGLGLELREKLERALVDEPPVPSNIGGIVRAGYDAELDQLSALSSNAKGVLLELEARERERTGISSLKVKYTRVFGYYIEVTRSNVGRVPEHYRRKQTVANAERYDTEELGELETRILEADERKKTLETTLFEELRREVAAHATGLRRLGDAVATLDVHASLAEVAVRSNWVRPEMDASSELVLRDSRHPVIEALGPAGSFVPNDVCLGGDAAPMALVTGPNMGGKSTVMRQTALAVILAQMGSYVPAREARIGLVDRVHTRVGANDDLSRGQSTFMMEMRETATILREATSRSLVILDEIGRGTSTYDGLAIAWAVAEHLHDAIGCRALFATHYHELCELPATHHGMTNLSVAAREQDGEVAFLHRLVTGPADRSYGVHVARLAGVPPIVSARATALLEELERRPEVAAQVTPQLELFGPPASTLGPQAREILATLGALDVDRLTPVDALVALARLTDLWRRIEDE